jgi:DNA-directed RNA polymerase specialized sigma24 family protein
VAGEAWLFTIARNAIIDNLRSKRTVDEASLIRCDELHNGRNSCSRSRGSIVRTLPMFPTI